MKQKKSIKSSTSNQKKSYFNPYVSSAQISYTRQGKKTNQTKQNTYKGIKQAGVTSLAERKKSTSSPNQKKTTRGPKKIITQTKTKSKSTNKVISKTKPKIRPKTKVITEQMTPEQRRQQMRKKMPLTKAQRMKLKKKRQRQAVFKMVMVMCLTVGLVWGGITLKETMTKTKILHQVIKTGTLDTSTLFEGIILRDEKVISSEDQGYVKYVVAEGDKIEKDGLVYVLVDEENLAATTTEKEEVESQIYNEAKNKEVISNNQDKRYQLTQEAKNHFSTFYNNRYDLSTTHIYTLRSQLESSVSSRTELYATEQEANNKELIALRQDIAANMENYQKGKLAEQSGIISFYMDGYETENVDEVLETLDYKKYSQYKKATSVTSLAPSMINKEDAIYKLVTSNDWYVVTYINTKDDNWTQGKNYQLNFDNLSQQNILFTLISKTEQGEKTCLVFRSSNLIGNFLSTRKVSFSIGDKAISGLKIPVEALVELNLIKIPAEYVVTENNTKGVYKQQSGDKTDFIELTVQDRGDDCYYITQDLTNSSGIWLNDVLVHPETRQTYQVTESEVSTGVYVINTQVAKFKRVEILAQNEEYAIVKNNPSSELKEMDKIISNPKSIKQDQLLAEMKIQNK